MCLVQASRDFWASRNHFFKSCKNAGPVGKNFVAGFAKNESLYGRILTKHKFYQSIHACLLLTWYFAEKLKNKTSFKSKYQATRWHLSL